MAVSDEAAALPIERLEPRHAEAVAPLSVEAGWNQVAADWRLMIDKGHAFGIRAPSGQWIATALVLPLGPAISWISMVLVTASARRQGFGTRLLDRCLAETAQEGVAAGLDATEFGRPVYLPLGFRDVYALSRWRLEPGATSVVEAPAGVRIRPASANDLPAILASDAARSGFRRDAILAHLMSRASSVAQVAERGDGGLAGYVLGRDGHTALHVGPIVADDEDIALALLGSAVGRAGQRVILDVPDTHQKIRAWLAAQGATAPRSFMRMVRGSFPPLEDASHLFALAGPELA
jgi:ribosomal protein S18 acetylase RimI-like enzyme